MVTTPRISNSNASLGDGLREIRDHHALRVASAYSATIACSDASSSLVRTYSLRAVGTGAGVSVCWRCERCLSARTTNKGVEWLAGGAHKRKLRETQAEGGPELLGGSLDYRLGGAARLLRPAHHRLGNI